MNPSVQWAMAQGLITLRENNDAEIIENRRRQVRESMRRQRERRRESAGWTAGIWRQQFPDGAEGLSMFRRALRFYWAARGHVRTSKSIAATR